VTITSALFCYDLTTTFTYTPGLHISLRGHFCSHSPPSLNSGSTAIPLTDLHQLHISYSPIITSHHHALHITGRARFTPFRTIRFHYDILMRTTWTISCGDVLPRNYAWIQFHYTLLFHACLLQVSCCHWGTIHHSDYHGSNESKNYTDQELPSSLG